MKNFLVLAVTAFTSQMALCAALAFTPANNKIEWEAKGTPGFLRINGTGTSATGTLTTDGGKLNGTLSVDLSKMKTGIDVRDEHTKNKYLEVGKFPNATLTFKDQPFVEGKEATVEALLKIKTDEKPVKVTYTKSGGKVSATFVFLLDSYPAIGTPNYQGVTVAKDVKVTVEGTL